MNPTPNNFDEGFFIVLVVSNVTIAFFSPLLTEAERGTGQTSSKKN